ncbi:two-component system, chemotaxis family, response regulator CheY [Ruminococcus sp. YE71]|uniref:response regulator n=1 Tax=unclassified Ruminococcus TaxID=2608920 RepID=UPI0008805BBB|nr:MULTISPECIES: response regulator [unclassified Ruminococcus]SDA21208.1 two-component system, chemotaxis family, response regulator CheY [Ruminococcus sp. YE78]SFW32902.1 two-component system, chemotaxis family, response regulator CheY [Ruminococcus sp. YE71]
MKIEEMKVLVCDDSMFARKSLVMFIKSMGIENVFEAADGQQAIEAYSEHRPDLVFMDIVMPVVTGIDALAKIREIDADAKVIMASSVGTQNHLKAAIKAGATDFLQKPISNDQVKQTIENVAKGVI